MSEKLSEDRNQSSRLLINKFECLIKKRGCVLQRRGEYGCAGENLVRMFHPKHFDSLPKSHNVQNTHFHK